MRPARPRASIRLAFTLVVLVLVAGLAPPAARADLEDDLEDIASDIADLEARLEAAGERRTGLVEEILASQRRLERRAGELEEARAAVSGVRRERRDAERLLEAVAEQLAESARQLASTTQALDDTRADAEKWVRRRYIQAKGGDLVTIGFGTDELAQIPLAGGYLARLAVYTESKLGRYEALRNQQSLQRDLIEDHERTVAAQAARLRSLEEEAKAARASRADTVAAVEAEIAGQRRLLRTLEGEIAHFEEELDGLEKEEGRVRELLEEEQRKRDEERDEETKPKDRDGGDNDAGDDEKGDEPESDHPEHMVRPVPGAITSPFGPRRHPILDYVRMHTGIDMAAPLGQPIRAAAAGRVIQAGPYGGYGNTVIIDHGSGLATLYAHQSRVRVGYGDRVAAGSTIGEAGSSGLATGPHLHFEVRLNGRPVDPAGYL